VLATISSSDLKFVARVRNTERRGSVLESERRGTDAPQRRTRGDVVY